MIQEEEQNRDFGVGAILLDKRGNLILQQRDDIPEIYMPGTVGLFGGSGEIGESPIVAIKRELEEELELVREDESIMLFKDYYANLHIEHSRPEFVFVVKDINLDSLILHEGAGIVITSFEKLNSFKMCPGCKQAIEDYFKN